MPSSDNIFAALFKSLFLSLFSTVLRISICEGINSLQYELFFNSRFFLDSDNNLCCSSISMGAEASAWPI